MKHAKKLLTALLMASTPLTAQAKAPAAMKKEAMAEVDEQAKLVQEMVDSVFSFQEPGFQEHQTADYLTGILEKNGFTITKGVAGIPTAWTATWSNGDGPVVALGSDVDGLLGLSQMPGVPQLKPIVPGAPGHGEGHNSGMPLIVAAAIAAKEVMIKHGIKGKLMLWPGVAEELLATKAYYVRAGMFKDVDVSIFTHVASSFGTSYGDSGNNGMVSVEYTFKGITSHAAGSPWSGRSALDAVELMNIAWNMRREHLPLTQRSHYVITNGGGQPNIVPGEASVWYYFREQNFASIRDLYNTGSDIAEAAAKATGTFVSRRVLGYAAPNYGNKPLAEAAQANIEMVGMPKMVARGPGVHQGGAGGAEVQDRAAQDHGRAAVDTGNARHLDGRGLGRYRRHHVDGADDHHPLPVEHPQHDRAQRHLGDRDGDAYRAQGRSRRREGGRADRARRDDHAQAGQRRQDLFHHGADQGPEIRSGADPRGPAGDPPQQGADGAHPARAEEILL
jgi:amidohydrolase